MTRGCSGFRVDELGTREDWLSEYILKRNQNVK